MEELIVFVIALLIGGAVTGFIIGAYKATVESMKNLKESEEREKLFLKWVSREVEFVVEDNDIQQEYVWGFEFNHEGVSKFISNTRELKKYWEYNILEKN